MKSCHHVPTATPEANACNSLGPIELSNKFLIKTPTSTISMVLYWMVWTKSHYLMQNFGRCSRIEMFYPTLCYYQSMLSIRQLLPHCHCYHRSDLVSLDMVLIWVKCVCRPNFDTKCFDNVDFKMQNAKLCSGGCWWWWYSKDDYVTTIWYFKVVYVNAFWYSKDVYVNPFWYF